jgi:hypothetical protein
MVMHPHTKYHWPISKDKNVMVQTRKYYLKNNYLTFRSNVKVPSRSLWYNKGNNKDTPPYGHAPTYQISLTYLDKKILFKNNYLTFRSKVMVPRRSLRYTTNHLMVMHPHIKYHWPIWKDKNVMVRKSFAEKKQKQKKKIRLKQYISPFVRNGDIIKIHI